MLGGHGARPFPTMSIGQLGRVLMAIEPAWNGSRHQTHTLLPIADRNLPPPGLPHDPGIHVVLAKSGQKALLDQHQGLIARGGRDNAASRAIHHSMRESACDAILRKGPRATNVPSEPDNYLADD